MLLGLTTAPQTPTWQQALAEAVTEPEVLLEMLGLPAGLAAGSEGPRSEMSLRVPRGYIARMRRGDPDDPLLRQVLPTAAEATQSPGFVSDPVGDHDAHAGHGLLHKYAGRALLVTTGACAVHCRYCFRRAFPYSELAARAGDWDAVCAALRAEPAIDELILSGGDPLVLDDARLERLLAALEAVPSLNRLRLHTRLPIVLPERVTEGLCALLAQSRLRTVIVVHANHARELDAQVRHALGLLSDARVTLLNQAVLLRGVNDSADRLCALSRRLFEVGVLPYYLHQLDRARGTAHFEVSDARARALMEALRARLPGYLVPRLVREEAGAASKTPLI
jgi:EF-P beta-lysylation protein EpmB